MVLAIRDLVDVDLEGGQEHAMDGTVVAQDVGHPLESVVRQLVGAAHREVTFGNPRHPSLLCDKGRRDQQGQGQRPSHRSN